ncbi:LOW QUALITY PROTEIN: hypothetical protein ACHAWO_003072 [Cyclotella atomus]|uniref:Uncharacterized protein n=1 Tax=Cyclotella atomus TaxID=382360 RepID=A0ABD3NBZ3_9STRA
MLGDTAAIGIGAVAGAICRYQIGNIAAAKIARDPKRLSFISGWHTAGINVCGSLILGFLAGVPITSTTMSNGDQLIKGISPRTRLCGLDSVDHSLHFLHIVDIIGFLGRGEALRAISYIAANNIGGIGAAYTGFKVAKRIFG